MPPKPRQQFLATGAGNGHGYTTRPLRELPIVADEPETIDRIASATNIRDEPEAIGEGWLTSKDLWAKQHLADVAAARVSRPLLKAEDRLRDAERRAKHAKRRDLKGEFLALRGMLERSRIREQPPPASALERLERAEAELDRIPKAA